MVAAIQFVMERGLAQPGLSSVLIDNAGSVDKLLHRRDKCSKVETLGPAHYCWHNRKG
jgi:hypothetical protein